MASRTGVGSSRGGGPPVLPSGTSEPFGTPTPPVCRQHRWLARPDRAAHSTCTSAWILV
ncbi:hypothetical protein [Candidatus Oscillochloris fontis]|uniref:hypothetical protein n=1 Tax=Candidatus Oscillochloris fontis TaxID=2496868 RepID=UPI00137638EE|nr:hypothetical protein [Candidatus Oscillochloris fontis]